jgi:hypothetical protein
MDLKTLKAVVDAYPVEISKHFGDLAALHAFVGLPESTSYRRDDARDTLYEKIRASFTAGQKDVVSRCGALIIELIQNQIIDGDKVDFYFAVLDHLKDAVRSTKAWVDGPVQGDWTAAIQHAADHVRMQDFGTPESRERGHARECMVARAAKRLKDAGFVLQRDADKLQLEPSAETRLVERLEQMIAAMGGINLARRIFREIAHLYDDWQERYHVVPHPSATNASTPQIPWSYLLLLAAKHYSGTRPVKNTDEAWNLIRGTATNYAAVLDVQVYNPFFFWHQLTRIACSNGSSNSPFTTHFSEFPKFGGATLQSWRQASSPVLSPPSVIRMAGRSTTSSPFAKRLWRDLATRVGRSHSQRKGSATNATE